MYNNKPKLKARLLLANGMLFEGESIGAEGTSCGEIVFNTSMTGYQEILTDPSYAQQVIVMTYPEIGNYGINKDDFESGKIYASGFVVKNCCEVDNHYKSVQTISDYLKQNNIVGISKIDTRTLTKVIRENGDMNCLITTENITEEMKTQLQSFRISKGITLDVSTYRVENIQGEGVKLAVIDLGIKKSIIDCLKEYGCDITVYPADSSADAILSENFDAVLFSNGPGNPQDAVKSIETANKLLGRLPLFGICLGHQILSIVLGAKTYKLKYGHRGGNHPVVNLETNKVFLTSQNHGYAVSEEGLGEDVKVIYKNLNDDTVEGIECKRLNVESVQFHPEAAPGPYDANIVFESWINKINEDRLCRKNT